MTFLKIMAVPALILSLAACQNMNKANERNPAQDRSGSGEIGSVNIQTITPEKFLQGLKSTTNKQNKLEQAVSKYDQGITNLRNFCRQVQPHQTVNLESKQERERFHNAQKVITEMVQGARTLMEHQTDVKEINDSHLFVLEANHVIQSMGAWGKPNWQEIFYPLCQAAQ